MAGGEAKKTKDDADAIRHDGGEKRGWAGEAHELIDGMLLTDCLGVRLVKEWRWVALGAAHTVSA